MYKSTLCKPYRINCYYGIIICERLTFVTKNTNSNTSDTILKFKSHKIPNTYVIIFVLSIILFTSSIITVSYAVTFKPKYMIYPIVTEVSGVHSTYIFQLCSVSSHLKDDIIIVSSDSSVIALEINKHIGKGECSDFSVNLIAIDPNTIKTEIIEKENIEKRKTVMEKKILTIESIVQRLIDNHQSIGGGDDLHIADKIPSRVNSLLKYKKTIIAKVNAIDLFIERR